MWCMWLLINDCWEKLPLQYLTDKMVCHCLITQHGKSALQCISNGETANGQTWYASWKFHNLRKAAVERDRQLHFWVKSCWINQKKERTDWNSNEDTFPATPNWLYGLSVPSHNTSKMHCKAILTEITDNRHSGYLSWNLSLFHNKTVEWPATAFLGQILLY